MKVEVARVKPGTATKVYCTKFMRVYAYKYNRREKEKQARKDQESTLPYSEISKSD